MHFPLHIQMCPPLSVPLLQTPCSLPFQWPFLSLAVLAELQLRPTESRPAAERLQLQHAGERRHFVPSCPFTLAALLHEAFSPALGYLLARMASVKQSCSWRKYVTHKPASGATKVRAGHCVVVFNIHLPALPGLEGPTHTWPSHTRAFGCSIW